MRKETVGPELMEELLDLIPSGAGGLVLLWQKDPEDKGLNSSGVIIYGAAKDMDNEARIDSLANTSRTLLGLMEENEDIASIINFTSKIFYERHPQKSKEPKTIRISIPQNKHKS